MSVTGRDLAIAERLQRLKDQHQGRRLWHDICDHRSIAVHPRNGVQHEASRFSEGSVMFSGVDAGNASETQMRDLRGREISMIFQNPRAALNPIRKVGDQIEDVLRQHVSAR